MRHLRLGLLLLVACVYACCTAAATVPKVQPASVELSPSIQLVGSYDWAIIPSSSTGQPWSRCLDMVWRAVESNSSRVNFVPTHHWLPEDSARNGISAFCFMESTLPLGTARIGGYNSNSSGTYRCSPWTKQVIQDYKDAMTMCFAEALRQGMTLYIRPHLDDGLAKGAWRNGLLLQPMQKYGGFSYYDIMLAPLADALREALAISAREETIKPPPGKTRPVVYFALQGEMSATIMRYASDYVNLLPALRQRILGPTDNSTTSVANTASGSSVKAMSRSAATQPPADVKFGVGLNFNRLDDTTSVAKTYSSSRLSWLMWQVGAEPPAPSSRDGLPPIDVTGLRVLLTELVDFIGISAYAPYNLDSGSLDMREFENSAFMFGTEMRDSYGIDVLSLMRSGKLELQYSEFGIGGGGSYGGTQVAHAPAEVALRPFFGVYGPYTVATDPWSIPTNAAFRRQFYYKAMQWLSDPDNKTYKLSGVFIWSMASWDVLAVYPESTTEEGSYRDTAVAAAVTAYNSAVRTAAAAGEATNDHNGVVNDNASPGEGSGQVAVMFSSEPVAAASG